MGRTEKRENLLLDPTSPPPYSNREHKSKNIQASPKGTESATFTLSWQNDWMKFPTNVAMA
jgi:hypothetical protein